MKEVIHQQLVRKIQQAIAVSGKIPFSEFMNMALYAPGLGYYMAGAHKLGSQGDFVTAPEISDIFSYTLANQCADILSSIQQGSILEFGAGTGKMAAAILKRLEALSTLPETYCILEISPDLQQRQKEYISEHCPQFLERICWLKTLPENFVGIILANEVLDAMPVSVFQFEHKKLQEAYVTYQNNGFEWLFEAPTRVLTEQFKATLGQYQDAWKKPYRSEMNLWLPGWLKSLYTCLEQGVVLLIDYGFSRSEYYHSDRSAGTLMCHYQQQSNTDPFFMCGLQDITAHVDFTAVIEHAAAAGFELEGYTTQADFLLNCRIQEFITDRCGDKERLEKANALKQLTLPHEMGELFKVMGFSKHFPDELLGFSQRDKSDRL